MLVTLRSISLGILPYAFGLACLASTDGETDSSQGGKVVATIGDRQIYLSELDDKVNASNRDLIQALYDARKNVLDELIANVLLENEAAEKGVTVDSLIEKEISSNIEPISESEVDTFFQENRDRLGGQTLEQIGGEIRRYLRGSKEQFARQVFVNDLRSTTKVATYLDPPRTNIVVSDGERILGSNDAVVTIVEYSDFQ